jgi:hypothetical protein
MPLARDGDDVFEFGERHGNQSALGYR